MQTGVKYSDKPKQHEKIPVGKYLQIFIRKNIKEDDEGYTCDEYSVRVYAPTGKFTIDQEFINKVKAEDEKRTAAEVRAKRDELLVASDCHVLPDRPESEEIIAAWKAYRQALRDIPNQKGFPYDVVFPEQP